VRADPMKLGRKSAIQNGAVAITRITLAVFVRNFGHENLIPIYLIADRLPSFAIFLR
jgi:hypothetical protein